MTLLGEYRHVIDTKNRLFIPAKFREELGESFYITRKIMEKCLAIYSEAEAWEKGTIFCKLDLDFMARRCN